MKVKTYWKPISEAEKIDFYAILGRNGISPDNIRVCCWSKKKNQWCNWPDQDRFENWQPTQFMEIPE